VASTWLSASEAAERLGIDRRTVSLYIAEGKLPAHKTAGGHYRIAQPIVEALLRTGTPNPPTARVRTLAIVHHAGGVGKTTTLNLGPSLARVGYRVLLVDLDSQAELSDRLGAQPV
jgi:excisionase family DNA binding protein